MLITEYRIVLPVSVDEYQVGQLYAVAQASKDETGGGEGVKVLKNEPYEKDGEKGQYTLKIYYLQSKVPGFISALAPSGALEIHEEAWNAYPYCKTILTNPWMAEKFLIKIETWHKPDMGDQENVHGCENAEREIVYLDIAERKDINPGDYKPEHDPAIFKSEKTGRGPLGPDWKKELANNSSCPHMCAYKLVSVECKWRGFQTKLEKAIHKMEKRIFTNFHRQLFCWIDNWIDLSMDDIRHIEDETKNELDTLRAGKEVKGLANDGK